RQVLFGEGKDRDFGEVDLLLAGEIEKQIERSFEADDIDNQAIVIAHGLRAKIVDSVGEGNRVLGHAAATWPRRKSKRASSDLRSNSTTSWRNVSAASVRRRASPASSGT